MNNYIFEYYQDIKDGTVCVGKYVRDWYEFVINGLEKGAFFYDHKKSASAIKFIEAFCRHHEGTLAPNRIKLELWQKALISILFGIVDDTGARQFREAVVVVGRKNGKTLLASAIASYCMFLDGEYGGRIYFVAPKLEQANFCFDALCQMIYKEPMLSEKTKKRRTDLYVAESNTSAKPLAFNAKKADGLNISLCVADEIASWSGDAGLKFYEVLKSSFGARKQPLLLSISTAGYENDGIFDELVKRSTAFLKGNSKETRLAPFLYTIDDVDKWNDINELRKSNPNLNVSVSIDYLLEEIAIAEGSLSKKSEFLTKYCNIKQNSSQAWLDAIKIQNCFGNKLKLEDFSNHYCVGGIDLSQTVDLTACNIVIEKNDKFYVFSHFFMPKERIEENSARDGINYSLYEQQGYLTASGDNFVDYHDCYKWFTNLIEKYKIYPLKIGYDRYSAQYLVQDMQRYGFHMDDVYQGENLSPCIQEVEGLINNGAFVFDDNPLMQMHLFDSAVKTNAETRRRKLVKIEARKHIDGVASILDSFAVRQKYWNEVGKQLKNENRS